MLFRLRLFLAIIAIVLLFQHLSSVHASSVFDDDSLLHYKNVKIASTLDNFKKLLISEETTGRKWSRYSADNIVGDYSFNYSHMFNEFACPACFMCGINENRRANVFHLIYPPAGYAHFRGDSICREEIGMTMMPYTLSSLFAVDPLWFVEYSNKHAYASMVDWPISSSSSSSEASGSDASNKGKESTSIYSLLFHRMSQAAYFLHTFSLVKRTSTLYRDFDYNGKILQSLQKLKSLHNGAVVDNGNAVNSAGFSPFDKNVASDLLRGEFFNETRWKYLENSRLLSPNAINIEEGLKDALIGIIIDVEHCIDVIAYLDYLLDSQTRWYTSNNSHTKLFDALDPDFAQSNDPNYNSKYVLSFLTLLRRLEIALAFDINWMEVKLLFGYLTHPLKTSNAQDNGSAVDKVKLDYSKKSTRFCNSLYALFPTLSAASDCILFAVESRYSARSSANVLVETDDAEAKVKTEDLEGEGERGEFYLPDVVRGSISSWTVEHNFDFNFYFSPDISFSEGFLRLSINMALFNINFPNFGCVLIAHKQNISQPNRYRDIIFMLPVTVLGPYCGGGDSDVAVRSGGGDDNRLNSHCKTGIEILFNSNKSAMYNNNILIFAFSSIDLVYSVQSVFTLAYEDSYSTELRCFHPDPSMCNSLSPEDNAASIQTIKTTLSKVFDTYDIKNVNLLNIYNQLHIADNRHNNNNNNNNNKSFNSKNNVRRTDNVKIAFITAVFGSYESSCKRHAQQDFPADFICFTDNSSIASVDWEVDTTPYHDLFWAEQANVTDFDFFRGRNISKNEVMRAKNYPFKHNNNNNNNKVFPFLTAKFYKMNFQWIPRLKKYDIVVWLDGTIQIHSSSVARRIYNEIINDGRNFMAFEHYRFGQLSREVDMTMAHTGINGKYSSQDLEQQLEAYNLMGYNDKYWGVGGDFDAQFFHSMTEPSQKIRPHRGVWVTSFLAFDLRQQATIEFLNLWFEHILFISTQDQVSFSFVAQTLKVPVYSLPSDDLVAGDAIINEWYRKQAHGK